MLDHRRNAKKLKLVMISLGVVFLAITFIYIIKIVNTDTCGRRDYAIYDGGETAQSYLINNVGGAIYQENPFDREKNINEWKFCFSANSTTAAKISVINEHGEALATNYLGIGRARYCQNLVFPDNETYNLLGVRCDDCANIYFYEELVGTQTPTIIEQGASINRFIDNPLDWELYGYPSCWESVRYFVLWYLTGVIFLMILIALMYGTKHAEKVLFKDD